MKKWLLLALLFTTVAVSMAQDSFRDKFLEANILMEDKYYALSLPVWLELLKDYPDNANINYKVGLCYLNQETDKKKALSYLEKASKGISRNYDNFVPTERSAPPETKFYLAKAFHLNNRIDEAITTYTDYKNQLGKKHYLREDIDLELAKCENAKELMLEPRNVKITNLGSDVNSEFREFGPVVSANEEALYFTSRRLRADSSNRGYREPADGKYFEDIYVSYKEQDDRWTAPELLNVNVVSDHEATIGISSDGQTLYIYKSYHGNGNLYESTYQTDGTWSSPELIGSDVNTNANETHVAISADGQRLYFTSDRKGGYGGMDIYRCHKLPNGEWSLSQNLGPVINSPYDEEGPFIHPDDRTLYFSSKGHKNMGGYDIFYSKLDLTDSSWTNPVNIGYPINTTDDDVFYFTTPDGKRSYYSSSKEGGYGNTDLYQVEFIQEDVQVDVSGFAVLKGFILVPSKQPIPEGTKITVTDKKTDRVLGEGKPLKRNGSFVFILPSGSTYHINYLINSNKFFEEDIDIPLGTEYTEIRREIFLRPVKIGDKTETEIIVLTDDLLSSQLKWQLEFDDAEDEELPFGVEINYLDNVGEVIHTEYVSQDGYFKFYSLNTKEDYTLELVTEEDIAKKLKIKLVDLTPNPRDEQLVLEARDNKIFTEKGEATEGSALMEEKRLAQLKEELLNSNIKWQLVLEKQEAVIPEGTMVNYLDDQGEVIFSEPVTDKGYFKYHELADDQKYTLQLAKESDLSDGLKIQLVDLEEKTLEAPMLEEVYENIYTEQGEKTDAAELFSGFDWEKLESELSRLNPKWKILPSDPNLNLPLGVKVDYLDTNGKVLFSEFVSRLGFFKYHQLDGTTPYRMRLISEKDLPTDLRIMLDNNGQLQATPILVLGKDQIYIADKAGSADPKSPSFTYAQLERELARVNPKWHIITDSDTPLPLGLSINYLGGDGNILFTEMISPKGYFKYHTLQGNIPFKLQLISEEEIKSILRIVLEDNGQQLTRPVLTLGPDATFIEQEQETIAPNSPNFTYQQLEKELAKINPKWRILTDSDAPLPIGMSINYLNTEGEVMFSELVTPKGYFKYHKLKTEAPYRLQLISREEIDNILRIVLEDNGEQMPKPILMLGTNSVFEELVAPVTSSDPAAFTYFELERELAQLNPKWHILTDSEMIIPAGTSINYIDENGQIVFTEPVSPNGYFKYHELPSGKRYRLQLVSENDIGNIVRIVLEGEDEILPNPEMTLGPNNTFVSVQLPTDEDYPTTVDYEKLEEELKAIEHFQISHINNKSIPMGLKVNFLDKEGNVAFTEWVTPNGSFRYHTLEPEKYQLQFVLDGDDWSKELTTTKKAATTAAVVESKVISNQPIEAKAHVEVTGTRSNVGNLLYFKKFGYNKSQLSTEDKKFIELVEGLAEIVRTRGAVEVNIEASASKVPTKTYKTNENLSKIRAEKAKEMLISELSKKGINADQIDFARISTLVQGPEYTRTNPKPRSVYEEFQYVRITSR